MARFTGVRRISSLADLPAFEYTEYFLDFSTGIASDEHQGHTVTHIS
jgi:hypothetical protein